MKMTIPTIQSALNSNRKTIRIIFIYVLFISNFETIN